MKSHPSWQNGPIGPGLEWDGDERTLYIDFRELAAAVGAPGIPATGFFDAGSLVVASIWTCRRMLGVGIKKVVITGGDWS